MLIKMVAVETALVGWLSYWLFLVYADNPSVTQALADKLSKFPQFSFTTIDISVLVVIGVLSILLALKFQHGLRPGIRLERALQMLETLMKRNLFLESQVAELKLEKGHVTQPIASPSSTTVESQPGSWERAFRTPIEAGPGPAMSPTRSSAQGPTSPVLDRTQFLPPAPGFRIDTKSTAKQVNPPKPPSFAPEKPETKPFETHVSSDPEKTVSFGTGVNPANWEDSPKRVVETSGILNAPLEARKQVPIIPDSPLGMPGSVFPIPKKTPPPPGVIMGPGVSPLSQRKPSLRASPLLPLSKTGPVGLLGPSSQGSRPSPAPIPAVSAQGKPVDTESKSSGDTTSTSGSSEAEPSKPAGKPRPQIKKRFAFEEE